MLEIFAGCARLTGAVHHAGMRTAAPLDIRRGPHADLSRAPAQQLLLKQLRAGRFWYVHLGTPCTRWVPAGGNRPPRPLGLQLAVLTVRIIRLCRQLGIHYTFENPPTSRIWRWRPLEKELARAAHPKVVFDSCCFGAPFRKPGAIAGSFAELDLLGQRCGCSTPHRVVLQGLVKHPTLGWVWRTSLAGAYLPRWCRALAAIAARHAPDNAWGRATGSQHAAWDHAMAAATGQPAPQATGVPLCPVRYRLPWRDSWPSVLTRPGR